MKDELNKEFENINSNTIIMQFKKVLKLKEIEIIRLKNELEKLKNKDNQNIVDSNDKMVVYFSSTNQKMVKHPIECLKTDLFAEIEERLYQENEDEKFRETNNIFIANGRDPILRFKKLYENKIKDGDIIQLITVE